MTEQQRERFGEALDRVAGDEEMLETLATIAAEDAGPLLHQLDCQLSDGETEEAARSAHALKGMLSGFETGAPTTQLQPIIDAARHGGAEEAGELFQKSMPELKKLIGEIGALAST